jgi:hypothetical protein
MIVCQHEGDIAAFTVILENDIGCDELEMFDRFAGLESGMRESYLAEIIRRGLTDVSKECDI